MGSLTTRVQHQNDGACDKCNELFDKYPGFSVPLRSWFTVLQAGHPEAHISCAGRGYRDQELYFNAQTSKAHWGHSAHNYNAAIDVFRLINGVADYAVDWFESVIEPEIPDFALWYGRKGAPYYERPHIELKNWKELARNRVLRLVENVLIEGDDGNS